MQSGPRDPGAAAGAQDWLSTLRYCPAFAPRLQTCIRPNLGTQPHIGVQIGSRAAGQQSMFVSRASEAALLATADGAEVGTGRCLPSL